MTAAARAHPELIGRPRHAGSRVPQLHFRPAPLTPDVKIHRADLIIDILSCDSRNSLGGRAVDSNGAAEAESGSGPRW
jgi:hypothetical protein